MSPQPESPPDTSAAARTAQSEFTPEERAALLKLAHESILSALGAPRNISDPAFAAPH